MEKDESLSNKRGSCTEKSSSKKILAVLATSLIPSRCSLLTMGKAWRTQSLSTVASTCQVLQACHNPLQSVHLGEGKTLERLHQSFHWYGVGGDEVQTEVQTLQCLQSCWADQEGQASKLPSRGTNGSDPHQYTGSISCVQFRKQVRSNYH